MSNSEKSLAGILSDGPRRDLLKGRYDEALGRLRTLVAQSKNSGSPLAPPTHSVAVLEEQALDALGVLLNTARELGNANAVAAIEKMLTEVEADGESA